MFIYATYNISFLPLLIFSIKTDSSSSVLYILRSFQGLEFKSEEIWRSVSPFYHSVGVLSTSQLIRFMLISGYEFTLS